MQFLCLIKKKVYVHILSATLKTFRGHDGTTTWVGVGWGGARMQ